MRAGWCSRGLADPRAHNPRSRVRIPPPLLRKVPETGSFCLGGCAQRARRGTNFLPGELEEGPELHVGRRSGLSAARAILQSCPQPAAPPSSRQVVHGGLRARIQITETWYWTSMELHGTLA